MVARYVHTNLIAEDWRKLSAFYQNVFGCRPVGPQRNLSGGWLEKLTGLCGVTITGEHLRLPGFGDHGPTLEIFYYNQPGAGARQINSFGFSHLAFEVDDVAECAALIVREGGSLLGEVVTNDYGPMGQGTFIYARDPEGNFIELQSWRK